MTDESVVAIKITKEIPFFGEGDTLETRLRRVSLRGFPDVRIYEHATFEPRFLTPAQIETELHTPQPNVYSDNLARIETLAQLFKQFGIDITSLEKAYDFIARSASGVETNWTMIPPIVERWHIPKKDRRLDYSNLIGEKLSGHLRKENLGMNPILAEVPHTSSTGFFNLINDGSHRVYFGHLSRGIRIFQVSNITPGFPYYAAPQPYSSVKVVPHADAISTAMKVHIIQDPGQKSLYRLFPSGGIKTGDVRPPTQGEVFI